MTSVASHSAMGGMKEGNDEERKDLIRTDVLGAIGCVKKIKKIYASLAVLPAPVRIPS